MLDRKTKEIIDKALCEDKVANDRTTALVVSPTCKGKALITINEPGILCGSGLIQFVFKKINKKVKVDLLAQDGQMLPKNQKVAVLSGLMQPVLKGERVVLNFLSLLSGIATSTHYFVAKAKPAKVTVKDTRKTTPGLRQLEKYAVSVGGGTNHRHNLAEGIIVKDNHLKAAGVVLNKNIVNHKHLRQVWQNLRKKTKKPIEVEVETFAEFREIIAYKPDVIMLDNFSNKMLKKAVEYRNKNFSGIELEASGRITLKNIEAVTLTGVDSLSVGSITHSPKALDFSLEVVEVK